MAAANGDVKVTTSQLQVLYPVDGSSDVKRVTAVNLQILAPIVTNNPLRVTMAQLQVLGGLIVYETADFSLGASFEQELSVFKFETVDFYAATAYGDAYVRADFDITFRFSMEDNAEVTNWVRSVQPWEDDWTPEDPII